MYIRSIGCTPLGSPINIITNNESLAKRKLLIMSGLHGDEVEGVMLLTMILNILVTQKSTLLNQIIFAPIANPDGFALNQRWNFNNVDLNRNWPTKDWSPLITNPRYPPGPEAESESETRYLRTFIENTDVEYVIDLHSYKDSVLLPLFHSTHALLNDQIFRLSTSLGIPVEFEQDNLGYSIAGGFHTWCFENKIQNLTVEVEKNLGQFSIKERYLQQMINFISELLGS